MLFRSCSLAVVSAVFAMAFDSAMMLVLIWTCFLAHWLSRNEPEMRTRWRELILLPVFGVPWLAGQDSAIGWYFRLSAAYVVECVFSVTGAEIKRSGTQLWIDGAGIDVEAACSGLGILQLLMIAGTVAMSLSSAAKLSSFTKLLLIFSTAWCSNTLRVLLISTMAVVVSSESADSWMHDGAGLLTAGFAFVGLLTLPWFYHPATACKAGA